MAIEGAPVNLSAAAASGGSLVLDWRIDAREGAPVRVTLGGGSIDLSHSIAAAPIGSPVETRVPLRCFAAAGANLAAVGGPLRIDATTGFSVTLRSARIDSGAAGSACPN